MIKTGPKALLIACAGVFVPLVGGTLLYMCIYGFTAVGTPEFFKAVFIGTGVWKPNVLHIKGETLGHVHFGINYLNNPDSYKLGKKVIVIGAGMHN